MARRSTRTSRSVSAIRAERLKEGHERAHRRWTQGEEGTLTREFHAGKTVEEMAFAHRRTMVAIETRLAKLELYGAKRTRSEPGAAAEPEVSLPKPIPAGEAPSGRRNGSSATSGAQRSGLFGFLRRRRA